MSQSEKHDTSKRRTQGPFEVGEMVAGRYKVLRVIGRGGMGMVYLVDDQETDRRLALKTLLPRFVSHAKALQRFVREINTIRQLNHRGVVKVYDAQKVDGLIFYTMEYVEGKNLRDWIKERGRLGLGSTVRILCLLCDALEHAHEFTIHRDLSPDNVMVLSDGSIKLLDFGLAKLVKTDSQLTMVGVNLGKLQYNAPEQSLNAAGVDKRADIYSMGVMFYEMLTGEIPEKFGPITKVRPELPKSCNAFLEKAMADLPDERYGSAKEMAKELLRLYEEFKTAEASPRRGDTDTGAAAKGLVKQWRRLVNFIARAFRRRN